LSEAGDIPLNDAAARNATGKQAGLRGGSIVDAARQHIARRMDCRGRCRTPLPFQILDARPGQMTGLRAELSDGVCDDKVASIIFRSASEWSCWPGAHRGSGDGYGVDSDRGESIPRAILAGGIDNRATLKPGLVFRRIFLRPGIVQGISPPPTKIRPVIDGLLDEAH